MGQVDCCQKNDPIEEDLIQIFATSPDDNKIPNDIGYFGNYGGEYPQDNGELPRFKYEARYPSRRLEAPSNKRKIGEPQNPIVVKYRAQLPQNNVTYFNPLENTLDQKSKEFIDQLYIRCNANGEVRPYDDFDYDGWKEFYPEDDKFFAWKKGNNILKNQTKIYNINDLNNVQIYEGEMNYDNQKHGEGKLTTTKYVRIGMWRNDKFTGWGRECRRNQESLEGRFVNGLVNGKGIMINKNGDKYIGDFVDSRKHGKGELVTKTIKYIGKFNNNKMDGKGKIIFLSDGHEYEGQIYNNQIKGFGIFKWNNGDVYEGEMLDGKMNGNGKYTFKNGLIYQGRYTNGFKNGQGRLIYPDGKIFKMNFINDIQQGLEYLINDNYNQKDDNHN